MALEANTPQVQDLALIDLEFEHVPAQIQPVIKEILDWLNKTPGPVPGAN